MTEQMVDAAKQSAELSRLTLSFSRPFLLIVDETLHNIGVAKSAHAHPHIKFAFKNCGKSPALIYTIRARLAVTKLPEPHISSDDSIDADSFPEWGGFGMYSHIGWRDKQENVLSADETSTPYTVDLDTRRYHGHLSQEIRTKIAEHALLVVLHGFISYKDILRQNYVTEFMGYRNINRFNFEFQDREEPKEETTN
jgi:hypothetical protein